MSAIDQAFIRAYGADDGAEPAAPAADRAELSSSSHRSAAPHFRLTQGSSARSGSSPESTTAQPATSQRRPLSAFAQQAAPVEARFRPALEVDSFRWSAEADELCFKNKPRWQAAIDALLAADDAGRSLVGVCGMARGAGATLVTGCLARLLVHAGKTVAIVDGDFATAGLAKSFGIAAEIGWEDVLAGRAPLADAVVHALEDRLSVLPLVSGGLPAAEKLDAIHASISAGVLRYHYDLVLFDLGSLADELQGPVARRVVRRCRLDAVLLVDGAGIARSQDNVRATAPEIAAACLGVIENGSRAA
jgi:Mrp family chromosome partitioning ATPase